MMVFMFSLNKWEMLYNGTGWAHFLAFAFFSGIIRFLMRFTAGTGGGMTKSCFSCCRP